VPRLREKLLTPSSRMPPVIRTGAGARIRKRDKPRADFPEIEVRIEVVGVPSAGDLTAQVEVAVNVSPCTKPSVVGEADLIIGDDSSAVAVNRPHALDARLPDDALACGYNRLRGGNSCEDGSEATPAEPERATAKNGVGASAEGIGACDNSEGLRLNGQRTTPSVAIDGPRQNQVRGVVGQPCRHRDVARAGD